VRIAKNNLFFVTLFVFLLWMMISGQEPKPVIHIGCSEVDYYPYSFKDENSNVKGICPDVIQLVAEQAGYKVKWTIGSLTDLLEKARNGQIDAIMPVFKDEIKKKRLFFPENGIVWQENFFFTKKNNGLGFKGNLEDLKNRPIGVVEGYRYGNKIEEAKNLNKIEYPDNRKLLEDLWSGKVKFILGDGFNVPRLIKQMGREGKIVLCEPNEGKSILYIAFSKYRYDYEGLAKRFSMEIEKFRRSPKYSEILNRYRYPPLTVKLVADNWEPFYGEKLTGYGVILSTIREAFKRAGYKMTVEFIPWQNLLEKVKNGNYDAGCAGSYSKARENDYAFSDEVYNCGAIVFLKKKGRPIQFNTLCDLKGKRIGIIRGNVYEEQFDKASFLNKIPGKDEETNMSNLLRGQLDLVIINLRRAEFLLDTKFEKEKKQLEPIEIYRGKEVPEKLHLLISKKDEAWDQITRDFNYGLNQVKQEGMNQKIEGKKGVSDENDKNKKQR